MIALLKVFAPILFYSFTILMCLVGGSGVVHVPLAFLVFILPLRNVIDKLHMFPMGKDILDVLMGCLIVGWVMSSLFRGKKFMDFSPLNVIAFMTVVYMFFSLLIGYNHTHDFNYFNLADQRLQDLKNFALLPLLYMLVFNTVRERKWVWRLFLVSFATMFLMDYYLIQQLQMFSALVSRGKIKGTFVYLGPNEVAAFYNQMTVFLIGLFMCLNKKFWLRVVMAFLILIHLYCILFLFSRAAYLGLFIGLCVLFLFRWRILLIGMIAIAVSWQVILPEKVQERILETRTEEGTLEASAEGRLVIWQQSLELFTDNPVFGIGFGTFRHMGFQLKDTHNIYLKILAEQGIIGFMIFLLTLIFMLRVAVRLYFKSEDDDFARGFGLGLMGLLVTMMVNNMFGDRWSYLQLSSYLWVLMALGNRLLYMKEEEQNAGTSVQES